MKSDLDWPSRPQLVVAGCLFACGSLAAFSVDHAWSAWARGIKLPGDLRKAVELSEVFGHSLGAASILLSVWWVAVSRRRAVGLAILLTALAGVTANLLKGAVVRVRPHSVEAFQGAEGGAIPAEGGAIPASSLWDSRQRSFPSGHAATAWGLALGLAVVFPRGGWLFVFFACMASAQRVLCGAHYPSDVLAGAAIAFAWMFCLVSIGKSRKLLPAVIPHDMPLLTEKE